MHIWKEIIFSDDSRRENKLKYFYFVYYYFFYIIKTKIIYREIQAASGEWVNNYAHGSPRRDSLTNESAGDIIKRSIRRSWTISSKWLNCGNWWSMYACIIVRAKKNTHTKRVEWAFKKDRALVFYLIWIYWWWWCEWLFILYIKVRRRIKGLFLTGAQHNDSNFP